MIEPPGDAGERGAAIVVGNALAAQQWELHLADAVLAAGADAWETPPLKTYAAWLDELWLEHAGERGPALTPNQSLALWRRVVAESPEGGELIGHEGAAEWAAAAWQLLHRWQVDPRGERAAANEVDYRAFLAWCRSYRERLDAHGWIDRAELEAALPGRIAGPGTVLAADLGDGYPARERLFAGLASRGFTIEELGVPVRSGTPRAARLADAAEELRAAFNWAKRRVAASPRARVAIVVAAPATRRHELERLAAEQDVPLEPGSWWSEGVTLAAEPTLGAALDALALALPYTPYATFGRWLRSPFFAGAEAERLARARLDAELRAELRSQLPFRAAYENGVRELLADRAPESAARLERALGVAGGMPRATPSRWAHMAARFLTELGWQPPPLGSVLRGWQGALDELTRLTPIVGEISLDAALGELARLLARTASAALPIGGIHVLGRIEDVGPGYDAVWVTGFTDAAWPPAPHSNPLLPAARQRALGMPYATPLDAEARAKRALERLCVRSPELVVSFPGRLYDYETEPSPAIRDWPLLSAEELDGLTARRPFAAARCEVLADDAPPLAGRHVAGGAGALGRQARCPVRAFVQDRLGARPLEPLVFGVPARLRGIAVHRALEALLEDLPEQAALAARHDAVAASAERALRRLFGRTRRHLAPLYALEAEQLERTLAALLRAELARAPFRVRALEQKTSVDIGPLTLDVRIDRLDELADGSLAVLDYKTGDRATGADWFAARLRDAQVPLYACTAAETVRAAVVVRVGPDETRYAGFWPAGAFPGRPSRGANPDPMQQLAEWRTQLVALAAELAAGDARIFADDYEEAAGVYAPLTRVFEQLALVTPERTRS